MKTTTRTVLGSAMQAAKYIGIPHVIVPKTTLNEKWNIAANMTLLEGEISATRYYGIGNGGHRLVVGANDIAYTDPIDHDASHFALYKHLPFVIRPVANDLTLEQRKQYAMRTQMTIGGAQYYVYWLKRLPVSESVVVMEKTVDGITVPFIPDTSNLNPVPPQIGNTGTTPTTDAYLTASTGITVEFDAFDVAELINACKILYDNEQLAIISEMSLVAGVDRVVPIKTTNGASAQFTEVIAAQTVSILSCYHNITENSEGFIKVLDLGEAEPLITGLRTNVVRAATTTVGQI